MKIGIVVGESSGDALGANLINALHKEFPELESYGVGGKAMQQEGFKSLFDMERLSVMGLIEPIKHLPDLFKLRRDLVRHFKNNPPDVFIGIDAPDFNLGLEIKLKQLGIPTVHYVSPSVWAWRQKRIHKIAKAVDLMLTLFPFEETFYQRHNVPVKYVGHPLAEKIPLIPATQEARARLGLDSGSQYVALLPGSRKGEIQYMAEPFLGAALKLYKQNPKLKFTTSHVSKQREKLFLDFHEKLAPELPINSFVGRTPDVMQAADAIVVTSGTATLEAMLYKKPMVIAYRMSRLTHWLAKKLVKTPYFGLPNLLAGELLVPELVQDDANADAIADIVSEYLTDKNKVTSIVARFTQLHESLRLPTKRILAEAIGKIVR